jgi:hypothetical protein
MARRRRGDSRAAPDACEVFSESAVNGGRPRFFGIFLFPRCL